MPDVDARDLRNALGTFVTGVTVVTTLDADGQPWGFTANSFTSVSLDPPLVLICIAKSASTLPTFEAATGYAVNILAEGQRDLSGLFASRHDEKFARLSWRPGPAGNPILPDVVAWLDCTMHDKIDAGDHLILIGQVQGFAHNSHNPLGYCRGAYLEFGLELEAVQAGGGDVRVGAIIERDRDVLLLEQGAALRLPTGRTIGSTRDRLSLMGELASVGVDAELGFLFAVFEGGVDDSLWIYYRGVASGGSAVRSGAFHPLSEIPWERLPDAAVRSMLRRYVDERAEDQFSVYLGDTVAERVVPLNHGA